MTNKDMDREEFVANFLSETQETMRDLNNALTAIEASTDNIELINELFRLFHSLKGSATVMGLKPLVIITHAQEDLLDQIRKGEITVSPQVIKLLWEGVQLISGSVIQVEKGEIPTTLAESEESFLASVQAVLQEREDSPKNVTCDTLTSPSQSKRFFYDEVDVTDEAYFINGYLKAAREKDPLTESTNEFLLNLDNLINKFETVYKLEAVVIFKKMKSDFSSLVGDDGHLSSFLADLLVSQFKMFIEKIKVVEKNTQMVTPKNAMSHKRFVYRINENDIDAVASLIGNIVTLTESLEVVGKQAGDATDVVAMINEYKRLLKMLNLSSRDALRKILDMKSSSMELLATKVKKLTEDLARESNKKVRVEIEGEHGLIDKADLEIIERILIHVVRNAVDHGLESPPERLASGKAEEGRIFVETHSEDGNRCINISDDGRGIDFDAIKRAAFESGKISKAECDTLDERGAANLLFIPGVTSAHKVSSVSGRGVGLDIVKKIIEDANGEIDIYSRLGKGTRFSIKLLGSRTA